MRKSQWGPIVWNVLHCIVFKIKPQYFASEKIKILEMISGICQNLPCPDCAAHSSSFIRTYPKHMMNTKEALVKMVFILHNTVNKRIKKNIYNINGLSIYHNKNFKDVLIEYYIMMKQSYYSERMILNNFHRNAFLKKFYDYFLNNRSKFVA
jgi:hypothetical protein